MPTLYAGATVRFTVAVADIAGAAATPSTISLTLRSPTGARTTPTPAASATGAYYAEHQCDEAGTWHYRWETTGPAAVTEGSVTITRSAL